MSEINPNDLVAKIAKPRLTVSMIISFVVHIVLLILLSIGFLGQCFHYKTIHPKAAIKLEKKQEAEKQEAQEREDRLKKAQQAAQEKAAQETKEKSAAPAKSNGKASAADSELSANGKKKSAYEKKLEEKADPASAKPSIDSGLEF